MMDINVDLLKWFIIFLIKKLLLRVQTNSLVVVLKTKIKKQISNEELAEELLKPINRKLQRKRKV